MVDYKIGDLVVVGGLTHTYHLTERVLRVGNTILSFSAAGDVETN